MSKPSSLIVGHLIHKAAELDLDQKFQEADVFESMLKSVASGGTFEQGLREGVDSAVTLLGNAKDMEAVREITEYLRDVRDNIVVQEPARASKLIETPEELNSLMAFDS